MNITKFIFENIFIKKLKEIENNNEIVKKVFFKSYNQTTFCKFPFV